MKFLLDAHLPYSLKYIFEYKNFEVIHTFDLPDKNETSDKRIIELAERENYIVITKDSDFYFSHVVRGVPQKLILIKVGNMSKSDLKTLFIQNFSEIVEKISNYNLIEIYENAIVF